jgi:hypothetical protein
MNIINLKAVELGFPHIRGKPKIFEGVLCNRFTKEETDTSDAVYISLTGESKYFPNWIIYYEKYLTVKKGT